MPLPPTIVDGGFHIGGRSAQDSATEVDGGFVAPEPPPATPFTGEPKQVNCSFAHPTPIGVAGAKQTTPPPIPEVEGSFVPQGELGVVSPMGGASVRSSFPIHAPTQAAGNASTSDSLRVDPQASDAANTTQPTPATPTKREPPRGFRMGPRT